MSNPIRVLVVGHDLKFLRPLLDHFERRSNLLLTMDEYRGHVLPDTDRSAALLSQADVVFCEWCLGNAEWYSANKRDDQILIVRLHSQERKLPFLERVAWDRVDAVVFICAHHMETVLSRFPEGRPRSHLILNAIDCDALEQPKLSGAEFNVGLLGSAPRQKSPHLAVDVLERLREDDPRYRLHIKGRHPWEYDWLWRRPDERAYYEELYVRLRNLEAAGAVVFDEHGDDVPQWFRKIGFVLSTSDHEGSHQAVAEGMASGAIPVIRNWHGAAGLYPERHVSETVEEMVAAVLRQGGEAWEAESARCREFARERFDAPGICARYDALLEELLASRPARARSVPVT